MQRPLWKRTLTTVGILLISPSVQSGLLSLAQSPLFVTASAKANVLVILDNSNSMDEAPNGEAKGSNSPESKSEIARTVIRNLIDDYLGKINMGLMAYKQNTPSAYYLHNSPYDVSYNPANYDPSYSGPRDSSTKRFRSPNPSDAGKYIYYNVALPFYASSNQGNGFCYSPTADFDNGSEVYPGGPWDSYRCFRKKLGTSDALPIWGNSTSEAAAGYSTLIGTFTFYPTDSDLAQGILDFGRFNTWNYVSRTWFRNDSPGRGFLHVPIKPLDATQKTNLLNKLKCNIPGTPAPCATSGITNAGLTPIEGTLLTARDYFKGTWSNASEGYTASCYPLPESCGKNFVVLLTDGLPSTDKNGNPISDPSLALSQAASAAAELTADGIDTYVIGFALPYGVDPTTLNTIAAAGGTSTAYLADDYASLKDAFDAIFTDILNKTGSAASAATSSTSLVSGSKVFQARFNSGDWSGQLLSFDIDLSGTIGSIPNWDAGDVLDTQLPSSRTILTISRDSKDGIPFRWSELSALTDTTQADYLNKDASGTVDGLGSQRVDFLRGSDVSGFRTRSSKLGDIVHSTPFFVGAPKAGFLDSSYAIFASANAGRTSMVYVGANDGMLHGLDAETGEERIAYVPGPVYKNLSRLTDPNYGQSTLPHRYYVDGSPMVADAKIGGNWKTVLAGGLNGGGQGYYALDVTDPSSFSESNAASLVLWEFTDENDPDLGYTYNQPTFNFMTHQSAQIAKMNNGKWALIVGNGYNNSEADGHASTTGHAVLFVLFLEGGLDGDWVDAGDYIKIDTGVGTASTPNGLATPTPVDIDGDDDIDLVYAGDLEGNLWKFDLTDANPSNWTKGKLFTAKDASNKSQPITTAPMVVPHPQGGYMVGFGTGKYLEQADLTSTSVQTLYGIWDSEPGGSVDTVTSRSKLVEQTVLTVTTVSGDEFRLTSNNSVEYSRSSSGSVSPSSKRGWFMDLPTSGERVAFNPIARDQRFVFVTLIPDSSDPCAAGGSGWLMELDYLTGSRLSQAPFDVNGDLKINDADRIAYDENGDGADENLPPSGMKMDAIPTTPAPIDKDKQTELKLISQSSGNLTTVLESKAPGSRGRLSWRQILGD